MGNVKNHSNKVNIKHGHFPNAVNRLIGRRCL